MLTRAYDAIMASLQVPMINNKNVDYNASVIDDSVLNCKDYSGNIRAVYSPISYYSSGLFGTNNFSIGWIPFSYLSINGTGCFIPDEDETEPSYEDYSVSDGVPSGWTVSSSQPSFSKTYDPETKEIVCSGKILWQNTSGAAKTVYGVRFRCQGKYRNTYSDTSGNSTNYLVCREHFAAPVVVEDQGIISLTFTWRVGRAGLVSATAASAE